MDAKPNDLPESPSLGGGHDEAHDDGLLMHELVVLNTLVSRYVLLHVDADAGRIEPTPVSEERELADRLTHAGESVRARADRRARGTWAETEDER
jgi:hypothetical protein